MGRAAPGGPTKARLQRVWQGSEVLGSSHDRLHLFPEVFKESKVLYAGGHFPLHLNSFGQVTLLTWRTPMALASYRKGILLITGSSSRYWGSFRFSEKHKSCFTDIIFCLCLEIFSTGQGGPVEMSFLNYENICLREYNDLRHRAKNMVKCIRCEQSWGQIGFNIF